MKNCTPLWREAHFQVKMYKAHQVQTTFESWDDEKVHAVVARSTFRSQNAQHQVRTSPHFVGCKHGGRSKNVSNNFDPFVFFPDGEGYMYVRPPQVKNRAPEDLHVDGGSQVRNRYVTSYIPPVPPRTLRIGGRRGGKNVTVPDI